MFHAWLDLQPYREELYTAVATCKQVINRHSCRPCVGSDKSDFVIVPFLLSFCTAPEARGLIWKIKSYLHVRAIYRARVSIVCHRRRVPNQKKPKDSGNRLLRIYVTQRNRVWKELCFRNHFGPGWPIAHTHRPPTHRPLPNRVFRFR